MEFICYKNCSTCKSAKKYLDDRNVSYKYREIKEETPTYEELKNWIKKYSLDTRKLFNTSGLVYRELDLKNKLVSLDESEKIKLLSENPMLIKRPILVAEDFLLLGFKEKEWMIYVK